MRILLALLLMSINNQGLATALRNTVHSLVGKKLTSSLGIIAKINEVDEKGRSALHHAIMLGDLLLVEFFLANGANTQVVDKDDLIPLRYAERLVEEQPTIERMQITSIVLEKTRGLNKGGAKGWRPITWSIAAGDYARVIELRDRGADVFAGRRRLTTNQQAGRHNAVWVAEHLQDDRAIEILAEGAPDRYFPVAVNNGYRKFTQAMIDQGVDVNIRDRHGYSAAMRAANAGRVNDLQMLIDNGAQIDLKVLLLAIKSGNPKLVEIILDHDVSLARLLAAHHTMFGPVYWLNLNIDKLLNDATATKGGRRIIQMLEKEKAGMPVLPTTLITKLNKVREAGIYSSTPSLLTVAVYQGLEQETRQLLDYLVTTPLFIQYVNGVFKNTIKKYSPQEYFPDTDTRQMLLSNLANIMSNWQPEAKYRDRLLYTLRISILEQHEAAIEAVLDILKNNDGVYQELLIGLAIANKTENDDLTQMLLKQAVLTGIDEKKLLNNTKLLNDLSIDQLKRADNPAGLALLYAMKQENLETVEQLIDLGIEVDDDLKANIADQLSSSSNTELLEFFVDRQIISLDYTASHGAVEERQCFYHSILLEAAVKGNLPIVNKVISLGNKTGLDKALRNLVYYLTGSRPSAELEEKMLAVMKSLIGAGANVNSLGMHNETSLTQAIKSLQVKRVELLLEQGARAGDIDDALRHASYYHRGLSRSLHKENLAKIKQLLADKGLLKD